MGYIYLIENLINGKKYVKVLYGKEFNINKYLNNY